MADEKKKVCPVLTALMPLEGRKKPAFSCLEEMCAWWVHLTDDKGEKFGMCAIPAIVSVRAV